MSQSASASLEFSFSLTTFLLFLELKTGYLPCILIVFSFRYIRHCCKSRFKTYFFPQLGKGVPHILPIHAMTMGNTYSGSFFFYNYWMGPLLTSITPDSARWLRSMMVCALPEVAYDTGISTVGYLTQDSGGTVVANKAGVNPTTDHGGNVVWQQWINMVNIPFKVLMTIF